MWGLGFRLGLSCATFGAAVLTASIYHSVLWLPLSSHLMLSLSLLIAGRQQHGHIDQLTNLTGSSAAGILDFALHLDKHLKGIIDRHGTATYAILFTIVFAETGFVLTPFLPGEG